MCDFQFTVFRHPYLVALRLSRGLSKNKEDDLWLSPFIGGKVLGQNEVAPIHCQTYVSLTLLISGMMHCCFFGQICALLAN
jgi:hypothetical protein